MIQHFEFVSCLICGHEQIEDHDFGTHLSWGCQNCRFASDGLDRDIVMQNKETIR